MCVSLLVPFSLLPSPRSANWGLTINVPTNYALSVTYVSFSTEGSFDFFTAFDGATQRSRTSGSFAPAGWTSTASTIRFTFTSDGSIVFGERSAG